MHSTTHITRALPSVISSDTVIFQTGGSLSLTGTLSANLKLELVAGEDLSVSGIVSVKSPHFDTTVDTDGKIEDGDEWVAFDCTHEDSQGYLTGSVSRLCFTR